ncbi:MAG: PAS-domain containing protein [Alphaproteobacteria bacterium]
MRIDELGPLIAELSDSAVAVVAAEGGRLGIVDVSAALVRLMGGAPGDLVGREPSVLFAHAGDGALVVDGLFGKGAQTEALPIAVADGEAVVLPVSVRPIGDGAWVLRIARRAHWSEEPLRGDDDGFYRHAMEAGSDWTWASDVDHRIIYLSDRFSAVTGLDPAFAFGRTLAETADSSEDPERLRAHAFDLEHHRPFRDVDVVSATGGQGLRYFRISGAPIFDGDGDFRGYCGVGSDVTAETMERQAARAFEARVFNAIEELNDGFALFDADLRLVMVNDRFRALFEAMTHRLQRGARFRGTPRPSDRNGGVGRDFHDLVEAVLADPARVPLVEEYPLAGGSWLRRGQTRLKDGGLAIVITDITVRKQAEEAAARAEARLVDAIENLAGAFMLWDADDRLVLHNTKALDLYGQGDAIVTVGARFEEVLRRAIAAGHLDAPAGNRETWVAERVRNHRDCAEVLTRRYASGRWVRITEHRTREGGIVGIGVDITELKRREMELEKARQTAETANRAKSRFLAAASHDLRQPLHAMGLFVSSLAKRVPGAAEQDLIHGLRTSLDAMNELFSGILDLSRLEAAMLTPEIRDFPVESLFERMRSRFGLACIDKGLSLRIVPSGLILRSDPGMLERILSNFIANAVRYTSTGGIVVGCRRRGTGVCVEVWDTGPGIPREQLAEIFEEYRQLANPERDRRQGLGLGLAIVDRLSRLLRHQVEVTSRPGRGSMFGVVLPQGDLPQGDGAATTTPASPPAPPIAASLPGPPGLSGRQVLVIDDDVDVLAGMRAVMADFGCIAMMVRTVDEALAAVTETGFAPDLVVADYRLPDGRTGGEAIVRLRETLGVPVPGILVSGDTAPERLREARASGFQLLHKPVHAANLAAAMRFVLKKMVPA